MSDLKARFEAAVAAVRNAPADGPLKPSNEQKLKMYALFRQAQDGDVQGKRPGMLDPVGRFKYDAWAGLKGTSQDAAMEQYIAQVESFQKQAG
ncbi:MAG: acyl-CoA-binding protein [Oceanococcaceae bacterium]